MNDENKSGKKSILVVDDTRTNVALLEAYLSRLYSVRVAPSGELALEIAFSPNPPDLILLDVMMPDMDGHEVCRRLKEDEHTRNIPVIFVTAKSEVEDETYGFSIGAADYITKPLSKSIVLARVKTHLALYDRTRQLEVRNDFIKKTFGRYLSDEIVETILETSGGLALNGEKRTVTIMMTDLRGFSSMCESLPAENVVNIINNYLKTMIDIILKHNGTIDEFIGDAIMIIFGAPMKRADDVIRAIACATEMQLAMSGVNEWNRKQGYPEIAMGIGINTGEVVVGNIGSKKRVKYGVVGQNVNLTSRIESYTLGGQVLVSETTAEACGDLLRIDGQMDVMPKGLHNKISIYEIGGVGGEYNVFLPEKPSVDWVKLREPLPVLFAIVTEKNVEPVIYKGNVVKMTADRVEIQSANLTPGQIPERFSNIKISLFDHDGTEITTDWYAKVMENIHNACSTPPASAIIVHNTSMPPEASRFLEDMMNVHKNPENGHGPSDFIESFILRE